MNKAQIIDLITNTSGVLIGQYAGAGSFYPSGYSTYISNLAAQTGKYPALMGVDFAWGEWSAPWLQCLIDYAAANGLIEISCHFANPFTGGSDSDLTVGTIADLWTAGKPAYAAWHKTLDTVKARLAALNNAGVTVLWRPLHECNGAWGWWENLPTADYISLWREMHSYFTAAGLNNLLWVWSPNRWYSGIKRPEAYYPGNDYCDIVGLDHYGNNLDEVPTGGYTELIKFGKPFVLGEFGPGSGATEPAKNSFDYSTLLNTMSTKCPMAKWFMAWNGNYAIINQNGATTLLNAPRAITRDKMVIIPPPPTATIDASTRKQFLRWTITLSWSSTNGQTASISNIGTVALSGSKTITVNKRDTYTYTLTVTASDGRTATASKKVVI